ncbi:MAG: DUF975 family protein [Clostridia bacterium]|nr:DUF975 family protein [Clostridia bacterium]
MYAKDFRQAAWGKLGGKWGTLAVMTLIYFLIIGVVDSLTSIEPYILGSIAFIVTIIVVGPFELSWAYTSQKVQQNQDVKVEDLFFGFKNFVQAFVLELVNSIFIFLWSLLLIVPGIIKTFSYSMSFFILNENPEISFSDARKKSIEMMDGYKWKLFCLYFSFIGWILLSILTLGILFLWISPYMQVAKAEFYENLKKEKAIGNQAPKAEEKQIEQQEEK